MMNLRYLFFVGICLLLVSGAWLQPVVTLAAEDDAVDFLDDELYKSESDSVEVADPLEPFNRAMFTVNDFTYIWFFDPVATGYSHVVPSDIRVSFNNFFYNLQEPVRCLNALLQGRFSDAGTLLLRFVINSTGGVAGLGDPAGRELGFKAVDATLGETLGVWGIGDGFYLVVPFYGPTTLRDFTGDLVDGLALTPYYFWANGWEEKAGIYLFKELTKLSMHLGEYEDLKKMSFDPYIALRNVYLQHRVQVRDSSFLFEEGQE
ncbi:MAG: VacJ family lipoprotein [Deltaproteobacteria bacterium]|nr:VacJ family lipoprotein [Deltaproteobacteria bacterium]